MEVDSWKTGDARGPTGEINALYTWDCPEPPRTEILILGAYWYHQQSCKKNPDAIFCLLEG